MQDNMSYDPETGSFEVLESFDPMGGIVNESFSNKDRGYFKSGAKKESAVFTLRIKNTASVSRRVELFNPLRSIAKTPNPKQYNTLPNGIYLPADYTSIAKQNQIFYEQVGNGFSNPASDVLFQEGIALFSPIENALVYVGKTNKIKFYAANPLDNDLIKWGQIDSPLMYDVKVSCDQVPYKNMVEDLSGLVMNIKQMKIKTSSESQLNNSIEIERYSSFGGLRTNSLEPSSFLKPENQQTKLVDINKSIIVDAQTGLFFNLEPFEDMNITFTVDTYVNNTIKVN